jgi:hypothetical protein
METIIATPTSRMRFGYTRVDITPPVGIYHRCWGAARHDRAEGIHKPLFADIMWCEPVEAGVLPVIRVQFDLGGLPQPQYDAICSTLSETCDIPPERVILTCSHTHASGWFAADREHLPGGELIPSYLAQTLDSLRQAGRLVKDAVRDVYITYAAGACTMAANRDLWDDEFGGFVCGYNPGAPADDTLIAARVTNLAGETVATLVNYGCNATTLAWENRLISPDFVGAMRETVEQETQAPCIYLQGACGDLGPRHGLVGDTAVADANGRQLGLAALSTLESMGPPAADFAYQGPVISGATLGPWRYAPFTAEREEAVTHFAGGVYVVELPMKPKPTAEGLRAEHADWLAKQEEADRAGDAAAARDYGARAERAWRWVERLPNLPEGDTFPYHYSVYRFGDAFWVTVGGEPYSLLQTELRRRFPDQTILVSPIAGEHGASYLLSADNYGKGLYQEEPSILAKGCLERLIEAISRQIACMV